MTFDFEVNYVTACELQYWVTHAVSSGLGFPIGIPGEDEIYVSILIKRAFKI